MAAIYRAKSNITGETVEGTAQVLSAVLKTSINLIYRSDQNGYKIHGEWLAEKLSLEEKESNVSNLGRENLEKWDRITKPFKEASRRLRRKTKEVK